MELDTSHRLASNDSENRQNSPNKLLANEHQLENIVGTSARGEGGLVGGAGGGCVGGGCAGGRSG